MEIELLDFMRGEPELYMVGNITLRAGSSFSRFHWSG